jgi:DNA-directed RNA polymerase subunit RPC12/RpoP
MPLVAAKCTNCGGELQLDDSLKTGFCMFCGSRILVQEAIELKKVQVEGKVSVEGLATVENLLIRGNQSLEAKNYEGQKNILIG